MADDGYETSNSGEPRAPRSEEAAPSPAPPAAAAPLAPPAPPEPPEPPPAPLYHYRPFEQHEEPYQHFPFQQPYAFKREPDAPYDMTYGKREEELYNGVKRECDDPYSFVEEDAMCAMLAPHPLHEPHPLPHQHQPHPHPHPHCLMQQPKKRGRKKKIKDENG